MSVLQVKKSSWNVDWRGNPDAVVSAINTTGAAIKGYRGGSTTAGSGGTPGVYVGVSMTGGSGSGVVADITVNPAGVVSAVRITNPGTGGTVGDTLTASPGGVTGFSIPVDSIGIALSRTSGQTPCFIQVSASPITYTGTGPNNGAKRAYEDLSYSWDFGDPTGTEAVARPTDGTAINANTGQHGPEAAYVYRSAGTYTVTLTIMGKNGSGGYVTATVTQSVTVSAFSKIGGEWWADSNAGGTNAGTQANPFNTVAAINTAILNQSNFALHVAQGSSFSGTVGLDLGSQNNTTTGKIRVDSYVGAGGAGANPKFTLTGGADVGAIYITNGSLGTARPKSDIVLSNIDAVAAVTLSRAFSISGTSYRTDDMTGTLKDIYLDNCNGTSSATSGAAYYMDSTFATNFNFGAWKGSFKTTVPSPCIFGSSCQWNFLVGSSFDGDGTSAVLDHFIYPDCQNHSLFKWLVFPSVSVANRNYCVNTNFNTFSGGMEYCEYFCFSECRFSGTQRAADAGESAGSTATFNGTADIAVATNSTQPFPSVGQQLVFTKNTAITIFTLGIPYFVVSSSPSGGGAGTVQLSATLGGVAITAPASGSVTVARTIYQNYVNERNAFTNLAGDGILFFDRAKTMTVRDARVWNCTNVSWWKPAAEISTFLSARLYRNKIYVPSGAGANEIFAFAFTSGNAWSQPQCATDNIVMDARTLAHIFSTVFTDQVSAGSLYDRNQFYAPSDSDAKYLTSNAAASTFVAFGPAGTAGTWQNSGFDLNGSVLVANPIGWTVPPTQWSHFGRS